MTTLAAPNLPVVENPGHPHVGYGVKDEHCATVSAALLWMIEKGPGDDFTPEVKHPAWPCDVTPEIRLKLNLTTT